MATQVFNGDKVELIDPLYLTNYLNAGWTLEKVVAKTKEEADTNKSGKLSPEEVRAAAKEANIEGWKDKRINTLKKELGYDD